MSRQNRKRKAKRERRRKQEEQRKLAIQLPPIRNVSTAELFSEIERRTHMFSAALAEILAEKA